MLIDSLLLLGLIMTSGALALSEIAIVSSRRTRLVEMTTAMCLEHSAI